MIPTPPDSDTNFENLIHVFLADVQGLNSRQAYRHALAAFFRFIDDTTYNGHEEPGPPTLSRFWIPKFWLNTIVGLMIIIKG